jgi:hypothetical protein
MTAAQGDLSHRAEIQANSTSETASIRFSRPASHWAPCMAYLLQQFGMYQPINGTKFGNWRQGRRTYGGEKLLPSPSLWVLRGQACLLTY